MDALQRNPRQSDPELGTRHAAGALLALALSIALPFTAACSSNSTPKSLPPQTIAPAPPEVNEPVSNAPQESRPDEIPTLSTSGDASGGTASEAEEDASQDRAPIVQTIPQPGSAEATEEIGNDGGITMVIETPEREAPETQTSIFAAAEAERQRRADAGDSAIVLDNKTLKKYSKGSLTTLEVEGAEDTAINADEAAAEAEAEEEEDAAEEDQAEELWRQEQHWRDRVLDIRTDWRLALDRVVELEEEVSILRRNFYAEDDPFYRDSQIKPSWDRALDELSESKREAERKAEELDVAIEEGRRAGALPGWLREGIELEPTEQELNETLKREGKFHEPSEPVVLDEGDGSR